MPFSAATGRIEAASAAGTAASDPMQEASMVTRKSVATREIGLNSTDLSLLIQYFAMPAHRGVEGSRLLFGEVISECSPGVALPSLPRPSRWGQVDSCSHH